MRERGEREEREIDLNNKNADGIYVCMYIDVLNFNRVPVQYKGA